MGVFGRIHRSPVMKRVRWHLKRLASKLDKHFFYALLLGLIGVVVVAATAVALIEKDFSASSLAESAYWAFTTVMGQGDSGYVTTPGGWAVGWLLGLFGVGIVAAVTGALVGFFIDALLKEGQGMGASGYEGHIVVCGWNSTARDLIDEFRSDDYDADVVVVCDREHNPAGDGVYFVRGDTTDAAVLARAGIEHAEAAIIFPEDMTDASDMRSILVVLAIESMAPQVRTVVEVNNPRHVPHFKRADVDEVLVTSRLASHLMARTAMYPGLSAIVADLVSGGDGAELYRVDLPREYAGLSVAEVSDRFRSEHQATLLAVSRNGSQHLNPPADFRLEPDDDAIVIAESLESLVTTS